MKDIEKILAHHAGARLYKHWTGQFPSPQELASFVQGERRAECIQEGLAGYSVQGSVGLAKTVLSQNQNVCLAEIYQQLRRSEEKKDLGQVFTPQKAAAAALELIEDEAISNIIDPCCGAGDFLLAASRRWPQAKLVGVDIDALALAVARTRFVLAGIKGTQLVEANALTSELGQGFDLVAGNPPWGCKLNLQESQFSVLGKPQNSFVYFLELSAKLLRPGGFLTYVLPEAFIKVWGYQRVREWLLKHFSIIGFHYIPHLFKGYYAPAMLIAAKKSKKGKDLVPVWYQSSLAQQRAKYNTIPSGAIHPKRFNINWNRQMEELWQICRSGAVYLKEWKGGPLPPGEAIVDFSLGIVTGDNRGLIKDVQHATDYLPLLRAGDVRSFTVDKPRAWLKYGANLQQAAPLEKYQVDTKIVYRFIARQIVAAVDRSGSLTLNSLNIIVPLRLPFSPDYLTALLNSKLLNTFYMYQFFTGKVLTRHLKELPLKVGSANQQSAIEKLAQALAAGQGGKEQLDAMIYQLYGLDEVQQKLVEGKHRQLKETFFV